MVKQRIFVFCVVGQVIRPGCFWNLVMLRFQFRGWRAFLELVLQRLSVRLEAGFPSSLTSRLLFCHSSRAAAYNAYPWGFFYVSLLLSKRFLGNIVLQLACSIPAKMSALRQILSNFWYWWVKLLKSSAAPDKLHCWYEMLRWKMRREKMKLVLCDISASFRSELHEWLLGCHFSHARALDPLWGKAFLLQLQHYFASTKEDRRNVQLGIFWWYCRAPEGQILNRQLPKL